MASEVSMKSFISWDEFIRKCESWHKWSFFEPENSTEWAREENSLDCSKCYKSLMEGISSIHPFHSPASFFLDHINVWDSIEEIIFLIIIFNICINEKWVSFWMDVFHSNLEAIETSCFRNLHLRAKLLSKIL